MELLENLSTASSLTSVNRRARVSSQVQIVHKKIDLSNVTSKCGSKDNIRHKPGFLLFHHVVTLLKCLFCVELEEDG